MIPWWSMWWKVFTLFFKLRQFIILCFLLKVFWFNFVPQWQKKVINKKSSKKWAHIFVCVRKSSAQSSSIYNCWTKNHLFLATKKKCNFMKNDILVVRKDHIVNRIRCKEKKSDKNNREDCLFLQWIRLLQSCCFFMYKSINFISFLGNLNILNTSIES